MNRMTSVTGLDGEVTTYAYDAAGRRVETASRTLTTKYAYDTVGNLLTQVTTGATEIAYAYSYNRNGYITGEERTADGQTITSAFAYDALGQLTGFEQSTGYSESYAYDKVGNMTRKVISGMDGETVALSMRYNKGNQMTSMTNGRDKLTYSYDKNGSMVKKVLTSKQYGKLTDTYAYNALDQLVSCTGYDGYKQVLTYDANGMRLSKSEYGNADRSTLEELLRGNVAGLPEVIQPAEDVPEEYAWATTEYLYDITAEYYQVIQKNTADATTTYEYGLERIAAYSSNGKQSYAYDGRGSVATPTGYTPFGEQMGSQKVSGFGYNAEDYDAATGMLNLRARQYEPAMNRFSLKDALLEINRYAYCLNCPTNYFDADGWVARSNFLSDMTGSLLIDNQPMMVKSSHVGTVQSKEDPHLQFIMRATNMEPLVSEASTAPQQSAFAQAYQIAGDFVTSEQYGVYEQWQQPYRNEFGVDPQIESPFTNKEKEWWNPSIVDVKMDVQNGHKMTWANVILSTRDVVNSSSDSIAQMGGILISAIQYGQIAPDVAADKINLLLSLLGDGEILRIAGKMADVVWWDHYPFNFANISFEKMYTDSSEFVENILQENKGDTYRRYSLKILWEGMPQKQYTTYTYTLCTVDESEMLIEEHSTNGWMVPLTW